MPYCSACGAEIGPPIEDLHDPENLLGELEEGKENEDAHLKAVDGPKGPRTFCRPTGKVTAIVEENPEQEGEGDQPNASETGQVYEVPEQKSQMQILAETVTNPSYGLNENQIEEVKEWGEIYDGQVPPDMLQDILSNMSGVAKQTAALARQKYEAKLNKWIREQSRSDEGPPIGVSMPTPPGGGGSPQRSGAPQPSRPPPSTGSPDGVEGEGDERVGGQPRDTGSLREIRRRRRVRRRNDAADVFAEEAARQAAEQVSGEMLREFSRYIGLPAKILEAKAEKDPDWFFEKMEQWDIDIDEFLEPSEARKRELAQQNQGPEVDREVDQALQQTKQQQQPMQREEPPPKTDSQEEEAGGDIFDEDEERIEEEPDEGGGIFDDEFMEAQAQGGD